jgi:hypothetical protein
MIFDREFDWYHRTVNIEKDNRLMRKAKVWCSALRAQYLTTVLCTGSQYLRAVLLSCDAALLVLCQCCFLGAVLMLLSRCCSDAALLVLL